MKKVVLLLLAAVILINLASCGKKDFMAQPEEEKNIILGFSQIGDESDWRTANSNSIKEAAMEAGIQLMFSDAQQQQKNQLKAIRNFINNQVDYIAFSPIVETGWDDVLKEARLAGIPVIILDRAIKTETDDNSLYVTLIGSNFEEEGRKAGRWLLDKMKDAKGDINIVELQGTIGSSPAIDRKSGFEEIIKAKPNFRIIRSESADFMRSKGYETMKNILETETKKIDVLFAHNDDMAIGAIKAIEEKGLVPGKDIIIVSIDAIKAAFEEMVKGRLNCTVECNPLLGPQLMQAIIDLKNGKKLSKRIYSLESVFPQEIAEKLIESRKDY